MSETQNVGDERVVGTKGKEKATSKASAAAPGYCDGLSLPAEIFTIIAEFLIGSNSFGSLASLNATTHLVREATNAVLWTTVLLETITPRWNANLEKARAENSGISDDEARRRMAKLEGHTTRWKAEIDSLPMNCKYVKYVFWTIRCSIPQNFLPLMFPNLALCINHVSQGDIDTSGLPGGQLLLGTRVVSVSVYRPVSFYFLLCDIFQTPIRRLRGSRDPAAPLVSLPCYLSALQVYNSTYIYEDGRMDSENFDPERILLLPFWTHVQFHRPQRQRSRKTGVKDHDPERSQRNAQTLLSLIKMAGRFGRVVPPRDGMHGTTSVWIPYERRELYVRAGNEVSHGSAYILTTLDKEELEEMMNRYPDTVKTCPDVLRCRLFISSNDAASPESVLDVILQFEGWYARFPDLTPCRPSAWTQTWTEPVVRIGTAYGTKEFAEGILSGRLSGNEAELKALVTEIYVAVGGRRHRWHQSGLPVRPAGRSLARDEQ